MRWLSYGVVIDCFSVMATKQQKKRGIHENSLRTCFTRSRVCRRARVRATRACKWDWRHHGAHSPICERRRGAEEILGGGDGRQKRAEWAADADPVSWRLHHAASSRPFGSAGGLDRRSLRICMERSALDAGEMEG